MSKARKVSRIFEGELKSDELTLADGSGSVQSQKDANVELAQMIQDISDGSGNHDHDGDYSPVGHSHDDKSDKGHDHDSNYAGKIHGHSDLAGVDHGHSEYKTVKDSDQADADLEKKINDHATSGHDFLPLAGGVMKSGASISFPSGSGTIDGLNVATSETSPVRLKEFEEYKQNAGGSYDDQWVKDALLKEEQDRKKADSDLDSAKADTGHTHAAPPLPDHDHPHDHDGNYSPKTHGHSDYSNVNHGHSEYKLKAEADGEHQALRTDLTAEVDNRKKGDDALQAQIDNIQHTPPYDDTQITADLAQEVIDRDAGDKALDAKITKEVADREAGDADLQGQIDSLQPYDDTQINAALEQEIKDREDADAVLQVQLDDLLDLDAQTGDVTAVENFQSKGQLVYYPQTYQLGSDLAVYHAHFKANPAAVGLNHDLVGGGRIKWCNEFPVGSVLVIKGAAATLAYEVTAVQQAGSNGRAQGFEGKVLLETGTFTDGEYVEVGTGDLAGDTQLLLDGVVVGDSAWGPRIDSLESVDHSHDHDEYATKIDLEELQVEVDALAETREAGRWNVPTNYTDAPRPGQVSFATYAMGARNQIWLNETDLDGTVHKFAGLEVGDYLEVVQETGDKVGVYGLHVITEDWGTEGDVRTLLTDSYQSNGNLSPGNVVFIKIFHANSDLDLAELDERYALKAHTHGGATLGRRFKWTTSSSPSDGHFYVAGTVAFSFTDLDGGLRKMTEGPEFSWTNVLRMTVWDLDGKMQYAAELREATDYSSTSLKFYVDTKKYDLGLESGQEYDVTVEGYW